MARPPTLLEPLHGWNNINIQNCGFLKHVTKNEV